MVLIPRAWSVGTKDQGPERRGRLDVPDTDDKLCRRRAFSEHSRTRSEELGPYLVVLVEIAAALLVLSAGVERAEGVSLGSGVVGQRLFVA